MTIKITYNFLNTYTSSISLGSSTYYGFNLAEALELLKAENHANLSIIKTETTL